MMLTGEYPFKETDREQLMAEIKNGEAIIDDKIDSYDKNILSCDAVELIK